MPENENSWKAIPALATDKESVLAGAGSRYTYSANTLAINEAREKNLESLALVGMSCQTSIGPVMWNRKVGKAGKPIKLNIPKKQSSKNNSGLIADINLAKKILKWEPRHDLKKAISKII